MKEFCSIDCCPCDGKCRSKNGKSCSYQISEKDALGPKRFARKYRSGKPTPRYKDEEVVYEM